METCSNCKSDQIEAKGHDVVCLDCGQTTNNPDFQNDEVKYIEQNGRTK